MEQKHSPQPIPKPGSTLLERIGETVVSAASHAMAALTGSPARTGSGGEDAVGVRYVSDPPPQKKFRRQKLQARKATSPEWRACAREQQPVFVNVTHAIIVGKGNEDPRGLAELVDDDVVELCFHSGNAERLVFHMERGQKLQLRRRYISRLWSNEDQGSHGKAHLVLDIDADATTDHIRGETVFMIVENEQLERARKAWQHAEGLAAWKTLGAAKQRRLRTQLEKQQKSFTKQRQQLHEDQERMLKQQQQQQIGRGRAAATVSSPRRLSESRCRTSRNTNAAGALEGVDFEFSTADDGEAEWDDSQTLDTSRPFDRFAADATSPPAVTTRRAERHCARAAKQMIQQCCDDDGKTDEEYLDHVAAATDRSDRTLMQCWKPTAGPTSETLAPRQCGKRKRKRRPPLSNEDAAQLLLRYPPHEGEKNAVEITRGDETRLDEGQFLNDSLIDFYLKLYGNGEVETGSECECEGGSSSSAAGTKEFVEFVHKRCHFFSSYFFSKLRSLRRRRQRPSSMQELERWTQGHDVLKKELLFIPINEGLHWSLAVICNPGNVQPPKVTRRRGQSATISFAATRADGASADNALDVCNGSDGEEVVEHIERDAEKLLSTSETETDDELQRAHCPKVQEVKLAPDCKAPVSNKGESETDGDLENKSAHEAGDSEVAPVHMDLDLVTGERHQKAPCILFLDSLKYHNESAVRRHIYAFLNHQWRWSHGPGRWSPEKEPCGTYKWERENQEEIGCGGSNEPFDVFNTSTMPFICPDVLRQDNSCDCGVFVLQYVEEVVNFVQKRSLSQRIVRKNFEGCVLAAFDRGMIRTKRKKLRKIIEDMNQKQADAGVKGIVCKPAYDEEILHTVPDSCEGGEEDEETQIAKAISLSQRDAEAGSLGISVATDSTMVVDGDGSGGGGKDELSRAIEASRSEHWSNSEQRDLEQAIANSQTDMVSNLDDGPPERLHGAHPGHNQGTVGLPMAADDQGSACTSTLMSV